MWLAGFWIRVWLWCARQTGIRSGHSATFSKSEKPWLGSKAWHLVAMRSSDNIFALCALWSLEIMPTPQEILALPFPIPTTKSSLQIPSSNCWSPWLLILVYCITNSKHSKKYSQPYHCATPTVVKCFLHTNCLVYIFADLALRIIKSGLGRWLRDWIKVFAMLAQ